MWGEVDVDLNTISVDLYYLFQKNLLIHHFCFNFYHGLLNRGDYSQYKLSTFVLLL
jgi:hypothetical protein